MIAEQGYVDFVQRVQLQSIAMTECAASRTSSHGVVATQLEVQSGHRVTDEGVDYRFEFKCTPTDDQSGQVAEIRVVMVATFELEGSATPEPEFVAQFAQDVAFMAVYPYGREVMQSLAARLEIPSLTLGLVRRGDVQIGPSGEKANELSTSP